MILRIFATDGHTPERIFRWSVEETAQHLCDQQVLWVTKLDGPWRPLVEWFQKQPCCRAIVLDTADRWEWNLEHEVTWKIAQGLYFQDEPEAVCWIHDDMAPPECKGFKAYLEAWRGSAAVVMEAPCYQLWSSLPETDPAYSTPRLFQDIRADDVGVRFAGDLHCWMAKWQSDLRWLLPKGQRYGPTDAPDRFKPLGTGGAWTSPWPFRHAKGVVREFREQEGFVRRGFPADRWKNADGVRCVPYDPEATWEEFKKGIEA